MIDITVQPLNVQFSAPQGDDSTEGQLGFVFGVPLPFAQGPGQDPIVAPLGLLRLNFNKEALESIAKGAKELAEKIKEPSNLAIASNLNGVDEAVRSTQNLRG